jgi:DNA-binding transcriptional LysR family regulator
VRRFLGGKASPWNFRAKDRSITTLDIDAAVLTLSAPEAMAQAASLGLGIAHVGVHHAWRYLAAGDLKVVLFGAHDPGSYEMVMQFPHRALMAPRVRATIDYLLASFEKDEALHVPLGALKRYAITA